MRFTSFNDRELSYLAQLMAATPGCQLERLSGALGPNLRLANKISIIVMNMKVGQTVRVPIPEMGEMDEAKDISYDWHTRATDEHLSVYDPNDPITSNEVDWMSREINSGDMTPDEFLRRSA